jgi:hypothetical protein
VGLVSTLLSKVKREPRPGPSVRFIVIRWGVALVALLLAGAAGVAFTRSTDRDSPGQHAPPP